MKTLAGVAHGLSRTLVERAADVMLKERHPLIIVPRETPMSLPQLKNMVSCGEAGAVTTDDPDVALRIKRLRDHGQTQKYYHEVEGYNGRLDSIQAGLLHVKLQYLSKWNAQRRERAAAYNRLLANNPAILCPYEPTWSHAVYHLYVVRAADRDSLISYLKACGIGTGIHYPVPLHMQRAYTSLGYGPVDFPVTTRVADRIVSLPMFPQLTASQQEGVVEQIRAFTLASTRKEPAEIAIGVAEMTA